MPSLPAWTDVGATNKDQYAARFEIWMHKNKKSYHDKLEEKQRMFQNFKENCRFIDEYNKQHSYKIHVDKFADLPVDEFKSHVDKLISSYKAKAKGKGKAQDIKDEAGSNDADGKEEILLLQKLDANGTVARNLELGSSSGIDSGHVAAVCGEHDDVKDQKIRKSEICGSSDDQPCKKESRPLMELPNHVPGRKTILSLDGGGVRGIILCVYLVYLETTLQERDGKDARLADYFDVIAGVSTGGLIAAMLVILNEMGRPKFQAKDILNFYLEHAAKIFPPSKNCVCRCRRTIKRLFGPKYSGKYLHQIVRDMFGETRLNDGLATGLFILAYDLKKSQPVNFSNLNDDPQRNVAVADACIGTSAAPTFLPSHPCKTKDAQGQVLREFNLIDGGVVANNPTYHVIKEVTREVSPTNDLQPMVLSLGTGCKDITDKYKDAKTSSWCLIHWLCLLKNVLLRSPSHADDFKDIEYTRIQDWTLSGDLTSLDLATEKNLKDLQIFGKESLKRMMMRKNPDTGTLEFHPDDITNETALRRFADLLRENKSRKKINMKA